MLDLRASHIPLTLRALWLPEMNRGTDIASSVPGVLSLPVTGALKASTAEGVQFTGVNTSNVNGGAIHDAQASLWLSFRFRPDWDYGVGSGDQYLFGKYLDADNYLEVWLNSADGTLNFRHRSAAATLFTLTSTQTSWVAGTWYHILVSISAANGARMRINGGTAVTDADTTAAPNGGDFVIGDFDDPGAGTGFRGTISDVVWGTDALSANEEADLAKGAWPVDAVGCWLFDEGRGTTANDRGSGGVNGTLDTSAYWKFGPCKQVVVSFDGINDRCNGGNHRIDGDLTFFQVMRMKTTYNALAASTDRWFMMGGPSGSNYWQLFYDQSEDTITFTWGAGSPATAVSITTTERPAIDDYWIVACPVEVGGTRAIYINGDSVASGGSSLGQFAGPSVMRDAWSGASMYDNHQTLLLGVVDGAMNAADIKALSRFLNEQLRLGISI